MHEAVVQVEHVKGSLKTHLEFWKFIGTSNFILNVMSNGYRLPFRENPPVGFFKNNASALNNSGFIESFSLMMAGL